MKLTCRIVKATRLSEDSQPWLSSTAFAAILVGQLQIADKFNDRRLLTEYVESWSEMSEKLNTECPLFFDHVILEDKMNHLSLLFYESYDDWKTAMDIMDGSREKERFFAARAALAKLWNVSIEIYEPLEFELTPSTSITIDDLLTRLANSQDLVTRAG